MYVAQPGEDDGADGPRAFLGESLLGFVERVLTDVEHVVADELQLDGHREHHAAGAETEHALRSRSHTHHTHTHAHAHRPHTSR